MPAAAFVSYSHADEKRLERLHKHLAMLRRDGQLEEWTDHEILVGDKLDEEVRRNLEASTLFVALVSPDYLASNYCYEKEFQYALALQERGLLRIVAVIVEPCDWQSSPFRKLLVLPKDGKPVADWTSENTAYLNVVTELRRVLSRGDAAGAAPPKASVAAPADGDPARRIKLKQDFDAIQRADFADGAFQAIRGYFEKACGELQQASDQIKARYESMSPSAFTCTIVNRAKIRGGEAFITVHQTKGTRTSMGDISYVHQRHAPPGTSNGWFSVEADEYHMFLTSGMDITGNKSIKQTAEQAAAKLWEDLVRQAGIDYE